MAGSLYANNGPASVGASYWLLRWFSFCFVQRSYARFYKPLSTTSTKFATIGKLIKRDAWLMPQSTGQSRKSAQADTYRGETWKIPAGEIGGAADGEVSHSR